MCNKKEQEWSQKTKKKNKKVPVCQAHFLVTINIKCVTKSYARCYHVDLRSSKQRDCKKEYLEDVMASTK